MRQFNFEYRNQRALVTELARIKRYCNRLEDCKAVFQIYTNELEEAAVREITDIIEQEMPEAYYYGCLSCGNILEGKYSGANTIVVCAIFEYDTTRYEVAQISCSDPEYDNKLKGLIEYCNSGSWIKSVEILTTAKMLHTEFWKIWSEHLRTDLHCVGGCSSNPINEQSDDTYVFTKEFGFSDDSTIFFMLGGEDVHAYSTYVLGYEPLGGVFTPTSVERDVIHELNGQPAFEVYRRYLKIDNNEHFFFNVLGFPMIMTKNGIDYLRAPIQVLEDDSLIMSGEIEPGCQIRLSYGNPSIILKNIDKIGNEIAAIGPEAIRIYSCFTRKLYWGNENIHKETEHLADLAPSTGFFTKGELLRIDKKVSLLNATLVVVGLREGEPMPVAYHSLFDDNENAGLLSYEDRLINFIGEATKELEAANKELARSSVTDGMTKLYNRAEIQRKIIKAIREAKLNRNDMALIMVDIDNFKRVNDTYGHKEGDNVIIGLSSIMLELDNSKENCASGRWGGEEFMILIERKAEQDVFSLAEQLRQDFMALDFAMAGNQSISVGITMLKPEDTLDSLCMRVDKALYNAKSRGKNRVEIL